MSDWTADLLGDGYSCRTIPLGTDPDGEGAVAATLVRHDASSQSRAAVLYVHGFTDYFFQTELAERVAAHGVAFYALDLRKCGRSLREGQTAHYVSDLELYDTELDLAMASLRRAGHEDIVVAGHSTGGLITPLWLDRLRRAGRPGAAGLVLNSPWFDLQGPAYQRSIATLGVDVLGRLQGMRQLRSQAADAYGVSLHTSGQGEWDFELAWKPLEGFPVHLGWLRAVRRGHARLHRGLDVGCPSLVLRSDRSAYATHYRPEVDTVDVILDVEQIARWGGCLGGRTLIVPVPGARHDVFLSTRPVRERAYAELGQWLDATVGAATTAVSSFTPAE